MPPLAELLTLSRLHCELPQSLHPVSESFLEAYLQGRMAQDVFQRFFSLPNSDYIPLAQCVVELMSSSVWIPAQLI